MQLISKLILTASPNVVEEDYYAIKSIQAHSGYPLENTPILDVVRKGLCKASNTQEREHVGFKPEQVHALLLHILSESDRFTSLHTAALIIDLYWGTARFEEAAAITVENITQRGLTIVIRKAKTN